MVGEGKFAYTTRYPVGVVGAISSFNFPSIWLPTKWHRRLPPDVPWY